MHDFDKIFSEKLYHHKTPPPANGWDQLNSALDKEQHAKRKVIFWRVAAVVLLLLLGGTGWWFGSQPQTDTQLADKNSTETIIPKASEKDFSPEEETNLLALEEKRSSNTTADTNERSDKNQNNDAENIVKQPLSKEPKDMLNKQNTQPTPHAQLVYASRDEKQSDNFDDEPKLEQIQRVETVNVEPLAPLEKELLAMEPVKTDINTPVTIIYKPGAAPDDEEKNIALELLSELRNSNISFSEIRNAKAELLAKVFSKKENELTP
ncbi:hypothetical protein OKW21_002932 [Catalinimonas alkaloidigena]|uniref:hypothetical protein n=1 Tax=Catalinimonas alkaloidigena TaxID=1075417 RepID=UPI00240604D3|nr:hypothetical protein [Catalinimonas alkaloidigena]MDF9797669.1 hypothetical protein [Catalinimonas alkaloidigena]